MNQNFLDAVEENPVIAAIKSPEDLKECCGIPEIRIVFILYGDICSLGEIVKAVKDAGKIAMVHVDLISGLSTREVAVDFIHTNTMADGIITTKPSLIRRARSCPCLPFSDFSFWIPWHLKTYASSSTV